VNDHNAGRYLGYAACMVMAVLLLAAIYFMPLRMLFLDAPFMISNIINAGHPMIMEHRYGSFITQMWPWLGSLAGLSLYDILHLYNASFNVFYLAVAVLLVFKWKEYGLAVLLALYYTLLVSDGFYWTNNEIHQAVGWMFVWLGLYRYQKQKNRSLMVRMLTFELTAALAALTHPLMVIVLVFVWGFTLLEEKSEGPERRFNIIFSSIIITVVTARVLLSVFFGWYDQDKLNTTGAQVLEFPGRLLQKELFSEVLYQYSHDLSGGLLLFLAGLILLIRQKKYLLSALFVSVIVAYHLLFLAAFDAWIGFYSQSELMPLTIIFGLPVVTYAHLYIPGRYLLPLFALVSAIRIAIILDASGPFAERLQQTQTYLDRMRQQNMTKALIIEDEKMRQQYIMTWGLPSESLIASVISADGIARTIKPVPAADTSSYLHTPPGQYLDCFRTVPISGLHQNYFQLDTTNGYRLLYR